MRLYLAVGILFLVMVTAGCSALGPGDVDRGQLSEDIEYDWNTDANATIEIRKNEYEAVYQIHNQSEIKVFRFHRFNNQRPIDPRGVQFRYPNGTIVGPEAMSFDKTRSGTVISLPGKHGQLGLVGPKQGKQVRIPVVVEGSHEVILPPDRDVKYFLLGRVSPSNYERMVEGDQLHLTWDTVDNDRIVVRYYLNRDLYLFGGLVAISLVVLIGGLTYYWLQLRDLQTRREEVALEDR